MTLHEAREAANAAEALARALAEEVSAKAADPTAAVSAGTWARCATLIIEHAEAMAGLIPRDEAQAHGRGVLSQGEDLITRFLDDEIPITSALASLERLQERDCELWLANRRLKAWQSAVRELMRLG